MQSLPDYTQLTDDELTHLAEQRIELTEDAQQVLDGELARRRITSSDVDAYRAESQRLDETRDSGLYRERVFHPYGIGKKFYGKTNYSGDPDSEFEEFDSTLWLVILWLPAIPLASYSVKRDVRRRLRYLFARRVWIVRKLPRN